MDVHPSLLCLDRAVPLHLIDTIAQRTLYCFVQYVQEFLCDMVSFASERNGRIRATYRLARSRSAPPPPTLIQQLRVATR